MLRYPTLAFAFALILIGYSIWDLDQLSGRRYSLTSTRMPSARGPPTAVPAMAGADSAAAFSGPPPEGVVAGAAGSSAGRADGQAVAVGPDAVGGDAGGDGTGAAGGRAASSCCRPRSPWAPGL